MHCVAMKLQLDRAHIDVMQMLVESNVLKSRGKHQKTENKMKIDLHLLDLSRKREKDSRSPNRPVIRNWAVRQAGLVGISN